MSALCLLYNSFASDLPWTVCAEVHLAAAVAVAVTRVYYPVLPVSAGKSTSPDPRWSA